MESTFFGGEKVVHYDPYGRKTGESKSETSFLGGEKIVHYGDEERGKRSSANAATGAAVGGAVGAAAGSAGALVILAVALLGFFCIAGAVIVWSTNAVIDFNGDMVDKVMSSVSVGSSILYLILGLVLTFRRKQSFVILYYIAVAVTMALAGMIVDQVVLGEQVLSVGSFFAVALLSLMFALPGMVILKICDWIRKKESV